ncbi:MAG: hypothetical protein JSS66_05665 [Armatimonadetes bacterium]|nr:hypothetical protein [Armatimonadota bacterium]
MKTQLHPMLQAGLERYTNRQQVQEDKRRTRHVTALEQRVRELDGRIKALDPEKQRGLLDDLTDQRATALARLRTVDRKRAEKLAA